MAILLKSLTLRKIKNISVHTICRIILRSKGMATFRRHEHLENRYLSNGQFLNTKLKRMVPLSISFWEGGNFNS